MMIFKPIITTILTITTLSGCAAFIPLKLKNDAQTRKPLESLTRLAYMDQNDPNESISKALVARTCVHRFLTQRSIQTFMFLLRECHDPHTVRWIEGFTQVKNLLSYHGTGVFNVETFPEWDSLLMDMMALPADVMVLKIENNLNGLSANNPFREKETQHRTIEIDIDPPSLVNRILSVRESLSREWSQDLELVIAANDKIMTTYNEKLKQSRTIKKKSDKTKKNGSAPLENTPEGTSSGDASFKEEDRHAEENHAFERLENYLLGNHPNMNDPASTPLRASNFDLLYLLSTQESVHRLLKNYKSDGEEKAASFKWLLKHYTKRVNEFFDGNQQYGRADEFLDGFLRIPPSIITTDGKIDLIDPLSMVEEIIKIRGEVAREWKSMMVSVPEGQAGIKREAFVCQMAKWGQHIEPEPKDEEEREIVPVELEELGEFQ